MAQSKIRVGLVRADWHAYTFAPLMAPCDVAVYRKNCHCEYYYMIHCKDPDHLRTPIVPGIEVTRVWDQDPDAASGLSDLFFGKPEICSRLEDVANDVDAVFISDCAGEGSDHLELAAPFLSRGIPTFVDKPFANTLEQAKSIVGLAAKYNAPLFSASILTYVDEVANIRRRFAELHGPVELGVIKGFGDFTEERLGGIIHGISLSLGVFGWGIESVECMGRIPLEHMLLHYKNGIDVVIMNTRRGWNGFHCDVYSRQGCNPPYPGHFRSRTIYDPEFVGGAVNIVKLFKKMVLTGVSPVTHEMLLEKIAIVEAARLSQKNGGPVYLKDLM